MAVEAHNHPDLSQGISNLQKENEELRNRVTELEERLAKICKEITEIKRFEWGVREDPPTIKKDIC